MNAALIDNGAKAMFVLVPLVALALLLLHLRRGFFYTEHLVFTAHAQTVTFALLTPGVAFASGLAAAVGAVLAVGHLLVAMKRFYGTGWFGTVLRWLAVSVAYLALFTLGVAGAALVAIMTS